MYQHWDHPIRANGPPGAVDEILAMIASANPLVITMMDQVEQTVAFLKNQPLVENLSYKDNVIRIDLKETRGKKQDCWKPWWTGSFRYGLLPGGRHFRIFVYADYNKHWGGDFLCKLIRFSEKNLN